jgi:hypothetical protein
MPSTEPIFAFVLMPFNTAFDDIYKLGIQEAATDASIVAQRVDEQVFSEGILARIHHQIERADIVVADMSGQSVNVFYEVGYAHAMSKLCLLLTRDAKDIPFDLMHHRHIVYGSSVANLRKRLIREFDWAKEQINSIRSSRIKVNLRSTRGNVSTVPWRKVCGTVTFVVDMVNETERASDTIDAVYVYTSEAQWQISQAGKVCRSTPSDVSGFATRYFVPPPARRLNENGWAPLEFTAERMFRWVGQRRPQSTYVLRTLLLRLAMGHRYYDHELRVDMELNDDA